MNREEPCLKMSALTCESFLGVSVEIALAFVGTVEYFVVCQTMTAGVGSPVRFSSPFPFVPSTSAAALPLAFVHSSPSSSAFVPLWKITKIDSNKNIIKLRNSKKFTSEVV